MDYLQTKELYHHGILGQKWGDRNGPPYPLSGGDYSKSEKKAIFKQRKRKNSIYNKKHFDQVIDKKTVLSTLSFDANRTKDADMFYAAYKTADKHQYNSLFNSKAPQPIYDENGDVIGTGMFYKYRINNIAKSNMKMASEDSGANAFIELYSNNRDFSNFVRDPDRMQSLFVTEKYKFKGYREAAAALDRIRKTDKPSEEDLRTAYRMMNYVIPSDGNGNSRKAKDITTQRAKLFNSLKQKGYSALLDTNDSIYGGFKTTAPVIVFDTEKVALGNVERTTATEKAISNLALIGRKALGI